MVFFDILSGFYSYLNLESTKTPETDEARKDGFYSYLNLESTKTVEFKTSIRPSFIVT